MPVNLKTFFFKFLWVGLSICIVSLPVYLYLFVQKEKTPIYLTTLIQKTHGLDSVSARFFSDYLGLYPYGMPLKIKRLDAKKIEKKLRDFPIFQDVDVEFTPQGELLVTYDLRKPLFYLRDYNNCALDFEGRVLPLVPFYSPKKLPHIYLGLQRLLWNQSHDIELASSIIRYFNHDRLQLFELKLIDLSKLKALVPSHREVILTLSISGHLHYLRINPGHWHRALNRYIRLFEEAKLSKTLDQDVIFDARISKFATLKTTKSKKP